MSKRKRGAEEEDYERRSQSSVGHALSRRNGSPEEKNVDGSHSKRKQEEEDDDGGEWETATSKRQKRRKPATKEKGNYPELGHSTHARLQSFVKIGDLQNLALYFLADGTSPQWCSIKNHSNVRKVVTLMVPGLETGLFNGDIPLESYESPDTPAEDNGVQEKSAEEVAPVAKPEPIKPAFPAVNPFAAPGVNISAQFGANPFAAQSAGGATAAPDAVGEKAEVEAPADSSSVAQQEVQDQPQDQPAETPKPAKRLKLQVSPDDFYPVRLNSDRLPKSLQPLADMFDHLWPVKTPGDDRYAKMHSPMQSMLTASVPRPKGKDRKGPQPPSEGRNWQNRREPVTEMLATTAQLLEEGYAMHPAHFAHDEKAAASAAGKRQFNCTTEADGWVDTAGIRWLSDGDAPDAQIEKDSITVGRDVLAMDCEMCITSPEGVTPQVYSLTRISLIDWNNKVILDEFVKPADPITNYLTPYSGITPASLEGVTTTLSDIHDKLRTILTPQTILVGHSLDSDLNALHITHPFIVDTALLYPHPRGPPLKSSLKYLAQKYLQREIQRGHGSTGHDSVEDAAACLDLVKQKCEKGKHWGTPDATNESIFRRLSRYFRPKRDKANMVGEDERRTGAVVDWGEPLRGFGSQARIAIGCESDADVVAGVRRALEGDSTGKSMPTNGVDFVWARFRELEAHQGWWNRSKTLDADALRSATVTGSENASLEDVLTQTTMRIREVYETLPPCTAYVVYSGSGDPRELAELQAKQKRFKDEYQVKKWDEVSVTWTDEDERKLRVACEKARRGLGFVCIK